MNKQKPVNPNPDPHTGNASNPSPDANEHTGSNQLIDSKGEKYLREVAPVEDYPDAKDAEEMKNEISDQKKR